MAPDKNIWIAYKGMVHKGRSAPFHILLHDDVTKWKHFPRHWLFVGNSSATGEFPAQRPVTRTLDRSLIRVW